MGQPKPKEQAPTEFQIEAVDAMRVENLQLKTMMLKKDLAQLELQGEALAKELTAKYGVDDIRRYMMNPSTQVAKLMETPK